MRVAISGASGLVGTELQRQLRSVGHNVVRLVRNGASHEDIAWNPAAGTIEKEKLSGLDAVVHLAGENIAGRRWSPSFKKRIRDSRTLGTKLLAESLAAASSKPQVLVSASATGWYGDRGDEECDEESRRGDGFLAEVCEAWEAATRPAQDAGIRVVNHRIGVVLSRHGGALQKMLLPFKLCAGGVVGSGKQQWSWISLSDLVRSLIFAIETPQLSGPVVATSPNPVTNREFTKAFGAVLGRPTVIPMPAFAARLAFGEMADALMLASTRVLPKKLIAAGFTFEHADITSALKAALSS